MATWGNVSFDKTDPEKAMRQFEVELNRRIRHALSNIDLSQLILALNDINGTLVLGKGGTGAILSAPVADRIMFYDKSANTVDWLIVGSGVAITDKTIALTNQFGDVAGGNYSEFESGGTLVFKGDATVWKEIDFPIIIRTTGANIPTLTTLQGNITAPQWQVNDFNVCEGQEFVHEWKEGSRVYWHIHLITNGLDVTDRYVKFEVEWFWMNDDGVISSTDTQSYEYKIPANTTSKTMRVITIYDWVPSDGKVAGHCYARLKRIAATGTAPTNDPWCTMLQLHIECDTTGSRTISDK